MCKNSDKHTHALYPRLLNIFILDTDIRYFVKTVINSEDPNSGFSSMSALCIHANNLDQDQTALNWIHNVCYRDAKTGYILVARLDHIQLIHIK